MFWLLDIEIWDLFVFWCLLFGIFDINRGTMQPRWHTIYKEPPLRLTAMGPSITSLMWQKCSAAFFFLTNRIQKMFRVGDDVRHNRRSGSPHSLALLSKKDRWGTGYLSKMLIEGCDPCEGVKMGWNPTQPNSRITQLSSSVPHSLFTVKPVHRTMSCQGLTPFIHKAGTISIAEGLGLIKNPWHPQISL